MKTEVVKVGVVKPLRSLGEVIRALEELRMKCSQEGYIEPRVDQMVYAEDGDLHVFAKKVVK